MAFGSNRLTNLLIAVLFGVLPSSALAAASSPDPASTNALNSGGSAGGTTSAGGSDSIAAATPAEQGANSQAFPTQILKTGVNLQAGAISANSRQLAEQLKLLPLLMRIQSLRGQIDPTNFEPTNENIAKSQQLTASTVLAMQIIEETDLAIEFVTAEIDAEENINNEILATFTSARDKAVLKTNALSFITNGALWAVGEALDIPTNTHPNYSVASGTFGILAGIVPTIASMYALKQLDGKKSASERDPNMLSKLFQYPTDIDIDYPEPVWKFLNSPPGNEAKGKTRRDQLIDRWISDKNISNFTDRTSTKQLDVITASVPHKNGLSISTLNTRQSMLQQLESEILKMKRLLYELSMVVNGKKQV
jgi:hypothetical protein